MAVKMVGGIFALSIEGLAGIFALFITENSGRGYFCIIIGRPICKW